MHGPFTAPGCRSPSGLPDSNLIGGVIVHLVSVANEKILKKSLNEAFTGNGKESQGNLGDTLPPLRGLAEGL
jgi:hypothetical protein